MRSMVEGTHRKRSLSLRLPSVSACAVDRVHRIDAVTDRPRHLRLAPDHEVGVVDQMHDRQAELVGQFDEAFDLLAGLGLPRSAEVARIARQHRHGPAIEPRERVHLAARVLTCDLIRAAHLFGQRLADAQFFEFLGTGHQSSPTGGGGRRRRRLTEGTCRKRRAPLRVPPTTFGGPPPLKGRIIAAPPCTIAPQPAPARLR